MATRGCLRVSPCLLSAFEQANQSGSNVRFLQAALDLESESIVLVGHAETKEGSPEHDFARLSRHLLDGDGDADGSGKRGRKKPRYFFFCIDCETSPRLWNLIAYIPDEAMVKEKMVSGSDW